MLIRLRDPYRRSLLRPKRHVAVRGFVAGAGLCLALVATPLWLMAGGNQAAVSGQPLLALSTMPAESSQFDIGAVLVGDWVGEMCPDDGVPVGIHLSFSADVGAGMVYQLESDLVAGNGLGSGVCEVEGEALAFHAFLAILSDCSEACGVDRAYEGHFEDGALVGSYSDDATGEECSSCVGAGSWWLEPAPID